MTPNHLTSPRQMWLDTKPGDWPATLATARRIVAEHGDLPQDILSEMAMSSGRSTPDPFAELFALRPPGAKPYTRVLE